MGGLGVVATRLWVFFPVLVDRHIRCTSWISYIYHLYGWRKRVGGWVGGFVWLFFSGAAAGRKEETGATRGREGFIYDVSSIESAQGARERKEGGWVEEEEEEEERHVALHPPHLFCCFTQPLGAFTHTTQRHKANTNKTTTTTKQQDPNRAYRTHRREETNPKK